jgi:hypothetical protein
MPPAKLEINPKRNKEIAFIKANSYVKVEYTF